MVEHGIDWTVEEENEMTDWKTKYEEEHKRRCDLERRLDHRISDRDPAREAHAFLGRDPNTVEVSSLLAVLDRFYSWAQAVDADRQRYFCAVYYLAGVLGSKESDEVEKWVANINRSNYPEFPLVAQRHWLIKAAEGLWHILDDIDTAGDVAKSNDKTFRAIVEKEHRKRARWFESLDGHTLTSVGAPVVIQIGGEIRDGIGEPQSSEGPPDVSVTVDIMALASWFVPPELVDQWTDDEKQAAIGWAGACHLSASDNDDVEIPPKPEHVIRDGRDIGDLNSPEWKEAIVLSRAWGKANNVG